MKKSAQKGFTLIELLVVVVIIAILALIVLLAINPVEMARRSRDSRRLSDLGTLRRAIDLSLADGKNLPITGYIKLLSTDATHLGGTTLDVSKYISVVPQDPSYDSAGGALQVVTSACAAGSTTKDLMAYEFTSDGSVYVLRGRLESVDNCKAVTQDGLSDDYFEIGTAPGLVIGGGAPTPTP